jgi:hypothetical protein
MSILIKGMEMPKDCWHCPMINNVDECCLLTEEQHDMYEGVMDQVQAAFCPLVEIPPHGRLIDADKLLTSKSVGTQIAGWGKMYHETCIEYAPTVIPADKEE